MTSGLSRVSQAEQHRQRRTPATAAPSPRQNDQRHAPEHHLFGERRRRQHPRCRACPPAVAGRAPLSGTHAAPGDHAKHQRQGHRRQRAEREGPGRSPRAPRPTASGVAPGSGAGPTPTPRSPGRTRPGGRRPAPAGRRADRMARASALDEPETTKRNGTRRTRRARRPKTKKATTAAIALRPVVPPRMGAAARAGQSRSAEGRPAPSDDERRQPHLEQIHRRRTDEPSPKSPPRGSPPRSASCAVPPRWITAMASAPREARGPAGAAPADVAGDRRGRREGQQIAARWGRAAGRVPADPPARTPAARRSRPPGRGRARRPRPPRPSRPPTTSTASRCRVIGHGRERAAGRPPAPTRATTSAAEPDGERPLRPCRTASRRSATLRGVGSSHHSPR